MARPELVRRRELVEIIEAESLVPYLTLLVCCDYIATGQTSYTYATEYKQSLLRCDYSPTFANYISV